MNTEDYVRECRRFDNHPGETRMLALALGLCAEAGEIANEFERRLRFDAEPLNLERVKLELGDVLWNAARIADELAMSLDEIMEANIAKLSKRYRERGLAVSDG